VADSGYRIIIATDTFAAFAVKKPTSNLSCPVKGASTPPLETALEFKQEVIFRRSRRRAHFTEVERHKKIFALAEMPEGRASRVEGRGTSVERRGETVAASLCEARNERKRRGERRGTRDERGVKL